MGSNQVKQQQGAVRLDARASILSTCQNYLIVASLTAVICIVLVVSTLSADMLIYDEGNVYSCPVDYMRDTMQKRWEEKHGDDEGKAS